MTKKTKIGIVEGTELVFLNNVRNFPSFQIAEMTNTLDAEARGITVVLHIILRHQFLQLSFPSSSDVSVGLLSRCVDATCTDISAVFGMCFGHCVDKLDYLIRYVD